MRRPLPPDLVAIGDQLEAAAAHAIGDRRARRQRALNFLASAAVAVPLVAALPSRSAPQPVPPPVVQRVVVTVASEQADIPPRRVRSLVNPTTTPVPDPPGAQR